MMKKGLLIIPAVLLLFLACAGGNIKETRPSEETENTAEKAPEEERDSSASSEKSAAPAEAESKEEAKPKAAGARAASKETTGAVEFMGEEEAEAPAPSRETTAASEPRSSGAPPQESGLKAGFADDNQQFGYFTKN